MRRCVGFVLVAALFLVAGCGKEKMALRSPRTKIYRSVVSLAPGATELVLTYGPANILKGRTQADNFPMTVSTIQPVASVKPDYEKLTEIKPDLVIYDAALYSQQDLDKTKSATGAEMFGIAANTLEEFIEELYDLGSKVGAETRMNEYVNKIYAEQAAASSTPITPVPKVAVMMTGGGGEDYVAGTKGFVASIVKTAGGEPVGPDSNIFSPMNAEAVIALNPDVIVVPGKKDNLQGAMTILKDPRYKSLNAIKNRRVRVIDQDVLLRRGSRVDTLIKALHGAFAAQGAN